MIASNEQFLKMKLHDKCIVDDGGPGTWLDVRKVVGGWIYTTFVDNKIESEIYVPAPLETK